MQSHQKAALQVFKKLNTELHGDLEIPLLLYMQENENTDLYTIFAHMFITLSLIIAKNRNILSVYQQMKE